MSPRSPQSFDLNVTKQRQQTIKEETNRESEGKDSQTHQEPSSNESQQREPSGTKRQCPWNENENQNEQGSASSQSQLKSSTHHARSIGVHSILNPESSQEHKRPAHESYANTSNMEILPPPVLLPLSPQRRSASSPLLAPISKPANAKAPYLAHLGASSSSASPPHNPPRRIITPVSPAMRYASVNSSSIAANSASAGAATVGPGTVGALEAKVRVSQSPFVPVSELSAYSTPGSGAGSTSTTATSTPIIDSSSTTPRFSPKLAIPMQTRHAPPPQLSRHSTPTLHGHHPSGGLATNPSSRASSPSTPHSTFSSFAHSSPSIVSGVLPPPVQAFSPHDSASQSPYMGMDPLSRTPSRMSSSRYGDDHHHHQQHAGPYPGAQQPDLVGHHQQQQQQFDGPVPLIPLTIDMKSGSRSQAEKRKANSDASRRFRNRKKNEAVLEQKIAELTEQVQFYRSERDFFRDSLSQHVGIAQIPTRPPSPSPARQNQQSATATQPAAEQQQQQGMVVMGGEDMSKSVSTGSTNSSVSHVLPSPVSRSVSLSSAAGQQQPPTYPSPVPWQQGGGSGSGGSGEYQTAYREDPRFATTNVRRS